MSVLKTDSRILLASYWEGDAKSCAYFFFPRDIFKVIYLG